MSRIQFATPDGLIGRPYGVRQISGCERAHMGVLVNRLGGGTVGDLVREDGFADRINAALDAEPACRLIARMHAQIEYGPWVDGANLSWFKRLIRESCESSVRVYNEHGGHHRESLLRVAMSNSGPADLNERGDRQGHLQTWWSLCDWMGRGPILVMSYSVTGLGLPEGLDLVRDGEKFFRQERAHMEWCPKTWLDWRAS